MRQASSGLQWRVFKPVPFSWLGLGGRSKEHTGSQKLPPFDSGRRARLQPCRKMGLRTKGCRPWAVDPGIQPRARAAPLRHRPLYLVNALKREEVVAGEKRGPACHRSSSAEPKTEKR